MATVFSLLFLSDLARIGREAQEAWQRFFSSPGRGRMQSRQSVFTPLAAI